MSKKPAKFTTAAKATLTTNAHKVDNIEARKLAPGGTGTPSTFYFDRIKASEVIVFNSTNANGKHLPQVPQVEETQKYLRDMWDKKMHEIKTKKLKVLYL